MMKEEEGEGVRKVSGQRSIHEDEEEEREKATNRQICTKMCEQMGILCAKRERGG